MPTERWSFEKVGLGYRCWSDEIQTEFRLTHIKRARGDLTGELAVATNIRDVKTHKGVLHVARFNVLSSSARKALSNTLKDRTPGQDLDWFDGLEWLCQNVILVEARGEPISEVGTNPPTPYNQSFLVEPLILKGRPALLFGPGGVGKSLVALTCGLSVACGREIMPGMPPALKGNVLYLDWETTADVINDRIQAIASGHNFKPSGMYYRRCVRPLADDAEELAAVVAEKKIVLLIVDSAAMAMGSQGEYGDANESVLRLHEAIRLIGVTSQIVDHVNKTDAKGRGGTATPYGSAYKTNMARMSWEIRKAPSATGLAINLYHAKSNDTRQLEPMSIALDWTEHSIIFRKTELVEEEEETRDYSNTREAILELLADGEGMTSEAICRARPDIKPVTIRSNLSRMLKAGLLTLDSSGNYRTSRPTPVRLHSVPGSRGVDA